MANKTLYVVTQTVVGLVTQSVDTFVLGYLEELDDVKNFLISMTDFANWDMIHRVLNTLK